MKSLADRRRTIAPWWLSVIQLSMRGLDEVEIGRQLGKTPQRIKTVLKSDWCQAELTKFQAIVLQKAAASMVDPIERVQALLGRAILKLDQNLDCGDPKVEHLAACRIIDQSGYAIVKRLHVSEEDPLHGLSIEQLKQVKETGRLPQRVAQHVIEGEVADDPAPRPEG